VLGASVQVLDAEVCAAWQEAARTGTVVTV
jgi:hypothetical protein